MEENMPCCLNITKIMLVNHLESFANIECKVSSPMFDFHDLKWLNIARSYRFRRSFFLKLMVGLSLEFITSMAIDILVF